MGDTLTGVYLRLLELLCVTFFSLENAIGEVLYGSSNVGPGDSCVSIYTSGLEADPLQYIVARCWTCSYHSHISLAPL